MEIQFLPVLVCAIISMVLGMVWYGPLFGRAWMRLIKADPSCFTDPIKRKEMQKKAMPLYFIQFILAIFQIWILSHYIAGWTDASGLENAFWIWAGFIMPTVAGAVIWGNDSRKDMWQKFFISAGFQLVLFIVFGLILNVWR